MLKGIPNSVSPDLMHALMSMGHGDELVLADAHFPASSHAQRLIRADGLDLSTLLPAVMNFFPIDTFVEDHAVVMQVVDSKQAKPPIWEVSYINHQISKFSPQSQFWIVFSITFEVFSASRFLQTE